MAFWGYTFMFNNIPSEVYNLYISSPDGGMIETTGAGDIELLTQQVFRNPKPYLLGVQQSPVLSFDVQFTSPDELMVEDIRIIQAWLFGQSGYQKLQIQQQDMQDIYFNCFLTSPKIIKSGNMIKGIAGTVVCDSPFAWAFPKTTTKNYTSSANETFILNNTSDNSYYTYPTIIATVDIYGGTFSITNNTDNGRVFSFTGLSQTEVLTIDNERCIITSSTGLRRLSHFNKNWFRLLRGVNNLTILGNVSQVKITYSPARKTA